jgi:hypothetical protein
VGIHSVELVEAEGAVLLIPAVPFQTSVAMGVQVENLPEALVAQQA